MTPQGVMPHPWWQLWQLGDFLVMLAVVVVFVRFMRRSDARERSGPVPELLEEPTTGNEDGDAATHAAVEDERAAAPRSDGADAGHA